MLLSKTSRQTESKGEEDWKKKDKRDPARKQAAVLGWPEGLKAAKRLDSLKEWVTKNFKNFCLVTYSNKHKELHKNRRLRQASYVHFATENEVRDFVKAAKTR